MKSVKSMLFGILCASSLFAFDRLQNWHGYNDTMLVWLAKQDTTAYTAPFRLSDFNNFRLVVGADDTSSAGFASDSIHFVWGYQSGCEIQNSSGNRDTVWDNAIFVVDTFRVTHLGTIDTAQVDSAGQPGKNLAYIDTGYVSGYATQSRLIQPQWDCLLRLWAHTYAPHSVAQAVRVKFTLYGRLGQPIWKH